MTWFEIGHNSLQAAKRTLSEHPRSSASRAYYAAHVVLTEALANEGWSAQTNSQTPPHHLQAKLIGQYLSYKGDRFVRELRTLVRRLYDRRLDADYRRTVTVDRSIALDSVRDSTTVLIMLGVR